MARRKSRKTQAHDRRARASWRGALQFGLVTFPVEAFNAHVPGEDHVSFHQLHRKCHSRIRYEKVCPVHGAVKPDEIVSGYETSKGRYVEIEPEELDELRTDKERSLTLDTFLEPDELDIIQLDGRMYFLSPAGDAAREPYSIFLKALQTTGKWGVGQVVWSGREQLALIRPYQDALHMAMLNYVPEIRDPEETIAAPIELRASDKKVRLAEQLIESWTDEDFDLESYRDTYQEKVRDVIDAKVQGKETVVSDEAEEHPEVISLMDALRKSLGKTPQRSRNASRGARKKRSVSSNGKSRAHRGKTAS